MLETLLLGAKAHPDRDFLPPVEAAIHNSGARFAYLLSVTIALFIFIFIVWANFAVLDEVTRGQGQIVPSSKVQVIQNLEGGIVAEIMAREGQVVEKDAVLVRIDNALAESNYREAKSRLSTLSATAVRLQAEIDGNPPVFPDPLKEDAPDAVSYEENQYKIRKDQQTAQLSVQNAQAQQKRQEVSELRSRLSQLEDSLRVVREELNMTRPLVAQGVVSKVDALRLEGQVSELEGEVRTIKLSIPRAQTAAQEIEGRIAESKAAFRAEAAAQLSDVQGEIRSLQELLTAGKDRVTRTLVRAPVRGTVKQLMVNTVGGVIQPGQEIAEVVPIDDTLLIEARVKPKDIAFIRPEQEANIKITAYDFSIYGGLKGVVENISADTITDEKGESFYRVYLRTNENALTRGEEILPIIPGMTATVEILTGRKTVFSYLMKPILKARNNALTER